jgi:hypothetical protein
LSPWCLGTSSHQHSFAVIGISSLWRWHSSTLAHFHHHWHFNPSALAFLNCHQRQQNIFHHQCFCAIVKYFFLHIVFGISSHWHSIALAHHLHQCFAPSTNIHLSITIKLWQCKQLHEEDNEFNTKDWSNADN